MSEAVSVRTFARIMNVSHTTVRRWLRDGYFEPRPDGTIDAAAAEQALAAFGLPRHRFEGGGADAGGGEYRVSLAEILARPAVDPFSPAAETVVAKVLAVDVSELVPALRSED